MKLFRPRTGWDPRSRPRTLVEIRTGLAQARRRARQAQVAVFALVYWSLAGTAFADPISAFILGSIGVASGTTAFAIGTFIINTVISTAVSALVNKLFGPSNRQQPRQASITTLEIGEVARELIVGRAGTGGSLAKAFNFGGDYGTDWECLVIPLADHLCDALEGYWVNDAYVAFAGDGLVAGYSDQLDVRFRPGTLTQTFPADLKAHSDYDGDDNLASVAHVWVAYKADKPGAKHPVWPGGRPHFIWQLRGARCYDPRKDSTVDGGDGAHRSDNPATWEWTENAKICRYKWLRGVYAGDQVDQPDQLLVGRGLSALEAPPEREFAGANVCDEDVDLAAGGTQKRYRVGGLIRADQPYIDVEEMFAAAMAGTIVQPEGGVDILPGVAKTPVFAITDDDLVVGQQVERNPFKSVGDRVNAVVPRYIAPDQKWADHAAPIRRDPADVIADRGQKPTDLTLALVTDVYQAQRCAEIARRKARLERSFKIVLPPTFVGAEAGDWLTWTSARRLGGETVTFEVVNDGQDPSHRNALAIQEISAAVFDWDTTDEIVPGSALPPDPVDWPAIQAPQNFAAVAAVRASSDLSSFPVIALTADPPTDGRVVVEETERAPAGTDVDSALWIQATAYLPAYHPDGDALGVIPGQSYDVRARNRTGDNFVSEWVYVYAVTIPTGSSVGSGGLPGVGGGTFPLDPPTAVAATSPADSEAHIAWVNPLAASFDHIRLWRAAGEDMSGATDLSGSLAGVWGAAMGFDDTPGDGTWWYQPVAYTADEGESAAADPVSVEVGSMPEPIFFMGFKSDQWFDGTSDVTAADVLADTSNIYPDGFKLDTDDPGGGSLHTTVIGAIADYMLANEIYVLAGRVASTGDIVSTGGSTTLFYDILSVTAGALDDGGIGHDYYVLQAFAWVTGDQLLLGQSENIAGGGFRSVESDGVAAGSGANVMQFTARRNGAEVSISTNGEAPVVVSTAPSGGPSMPTTVYLGGTTGSNPPLSYTLWLEWLAGYADGDVDDAMMATISDPAFTPAVP